MALLGIKNICPVLRMIFPIIKKPVLCFKNGTFGYKNIFVISLEMAFESKKYID
jgi:hypothetical protein